MATEAQIRANQANAKRSTGPVTPEGKQASRANSLKHGLTGAGIVLPQAEAAEIGLRMIAYAEALKPTNDVETALAHHAALCAVRMERSAMIESIALTDRVSQAAADFVPPEGVDAGTADRMRRDACARAMADTSKEGVLMRKYEAAAERGFFRALKELRQMRKESQARDPKVEEEVIRKELGSILAASAANDQFMARYEKYLDGDPMMADLKPRRGTSVPFPGPFPSAGDAFDVPFAIGKPR